MSDDTNDNEQVARPAFPTPDPYGQAALLLVESLIHSLIAKALLTPAEAVATVEVAQDVKIELADEFGDTWEAKRVSLALLSAISLSLRGDVR